MPPMYVNIGAYVGADTLVDSHALVGSCAQIGERVHLSAGAQIGGVIEPVGALPVIVEDDVLVGGNTGIYEGAIVKARAVIAAGTVLTGSTPIYDLVHGRIIRPGRGAPARGAAGRRRRARRAGGDAGLGAHVGAVARDAGHREVPGFEDRQPHRAGAMDPIDIVALTRALVDIDSTTGREAEAGRWLARCCGSRGWSVTEQPVDGDRVQRSGDARRAAGRRAVDALRLRAAVLSEPLCGRRASTAAAAATPRASSRRRSRRPRRLVADGERRVGLLFVVGEERGSDGAPRRGAMSRRQPVPRQRRADRQPARHRHEGHGAVLLTATGRAAHSAYPDRGESAIEKLVDAIVALRSIEWPTDPELGETTYSVGLMSGGVAPNVIPPAATAEVMFRTVGDVAEIRRRLAPLERWVAVIPGLPRAARAAAHGARVTTPRCSPSPRTCRSWRRGDGRCCSGRGRSTWRTRRTSTWPSPTSRGRGDLRARRAGSCCASVRRDAAGQPAPSP